MDEGSVGNAMGVRILDDKNGLSFDVGVDKRRDGQSNLNKTSM
jgi:hypothetical protein